MAFTPAPLVRTRSQQDGTSRKLRGLEKGMEYIVEFSFPSPRWPKWLGRQERRSRPRRREADENIIVVEDEGEPRHRIRRRARSAQPQSAEWPMPAAPLQHGGFFQPSPPPPPVHQGGAWGQPPMVHQQQPFQPYQGNPPVGIDIIDPNTQTANAPAAEYFNPQPYEQTPEAEIQRQRVAAANAQERENRRLRDLARQQHERAEALRESQRLQREEDERLAEAALRRREAERIAAERDERRRRRAHELRSFEMHERDRERRNAAAERHIDEYTPPRRPIRVAVHNERRPPSTSDESWQSPGGDIRVQPVPEREGRRENLGERGQRLRRERTERNPGGLRRRGTTRY